MSFAPLRLCVILWFGGVLSLAALFGGGLIFNSYPEFNVGIM